MLFHYWFFKYIDFKLQPYACNECHDLSMMVYDLDEFMILNIKSVDYSCFVCNRSEDTAFKLQNNSQLDNDTAL